MPNAYEGVYVCCNYKKVLYGHFAIIKKQKVC